MKTFKRSCEFRVVAKSDNTNAFGLYQLIIASKTGEAYKTHASMYNLPEDGKVYWTAEFNDEGTHVASYILGHEMTTKIEDVPQDIVDELFNLNQAI